MSRLCPVCEWDGDIWENPHKEIFSMSYQIPDGWSLPSKITWYECIECSMIFGDGDFTQADLDKYYSERYGYGVSNPDNIERLKRDADWIAGEYYTAKTIIDFGGAGDNGESVLIERLREIGFGKREVFSVGPNQPISQTGRPADIIYASHVLEHIYDLPQTMRDIVSALAPDGTLIVDVPDATGLLNRWKMPILDFNTKHVNHFTLRNLLELGNQHGLESVMVKPYELEYAPCFQVHFRKLDVAKASRDHVESRSKKRVEKLLSINEPFNIWGISDIVWHTLAGMDLDVLDYIDNDPAYRGQTFKGKPVVERPSNSAPIVIMCQGQRGRLIENIRKMGVQNEIIEI